MTELRDRLTAFLEREGEGPCVWGRNDCSAAPARWLAELREKPVELPAYDSRAEAEAIIAAHGGLANVWAEVAARNDIFEQYGEPQLGDVGLIDTRLYGPIGGIVGAGRILIVRKDAGNWHPIGHVREFLKVYAAQ